MTPQLMQAIKLLQLSNLDLATYVDNEVESNPLLEQGEESGIETVGHEPDLRPGVSEWADGPPANLPPASSPHENREALRDTRLRLRRTDCPRAK